MYLLESQHDKYLTYTRYVESSMCLLNTQMKLSVLQSPKLNHTKGSIVGRKKAVGLSMAKHVPLARI